MDASILISLLSLTVLEVVLGIDNLVILSILVNRAPQHQQIMTMRVGLCLAWMLRLIFLAFAVWLSQLTTNVFILFNFTIKCLAIKINNKYFEISIGCKDIPATCIHLDAPPAVLDKIGIKVRANKRKPRK